MQTILAQYRQILQRYWGYSDFRAPQLEVLKAVAEAPAVLAVLATGGGKSLCFQVPGLALGGCTLVISPLISLIEDQVQRLQKQGLAAVGLHSGLSSSERTRILEQLAANELQFLYLAPESLRNRTVAAALLSSPPNLVAIDEAHCISQWGHDFRPAYLQLASSLAQWRQAGGVKRLVVVTGTATGQVQVDIARQLGLQDYRLIRHSLAKPNISISTRRGTASECVAEIAGRLATGGVIVYAATRRRVEELAQEFRSHSLPALYFHGGLVPAEKTATLAAFLGADRPLICATNAFGMGVDKSNIYTVVHDGMPDCLENYYQEAGRAGRDGAPAQSWLCLNWASINFRSQSIQDRFYTVEEANVVYNYLCQHHESLREGLSLTTVLTQLERVNRAKLAQLLSAFAVANICQYEVLKDDRLQVTSLSTGIIWLARYLDFSKQQRLRKQAQERLQTLFAVFTQKQCRAKAVLDYFGERSRPCGQCDHCRS